MAKRDFKQWFSEFRIGISDHGYYTDFDKVYANVGKIKVELNILNSLIGSQDIESDFEKLVKNYPMVLKCIPILLAVRSKELYCKDDEDDGEKVRRYWFDNIYHLSNDGLTSDDYTYFMRQTGLFDLLQNHIIRDLVDYVTGVEVGLDSNARKNRGGKLMENLVERYIQRAGFEEGISYFSQMWTSEIQDLWNINLESISNKGKTEKRFDFVIKTPNMVYGIETNFYFNGGSKLNTIAKEYKSRTLLAEKIDHFTFVWITDGQGWKYARRSLEETFDVMEHIYSIQDLENGILEHL